MALSRVKPNPLKRDSAEPLILYEVMPPFVGFEEEKIADRSGRFLDALRGLRRYDAITIPEIVDENHDGRPHLKSVDARQLGIELQEKTGKEVILGKVAPRMPVTAFERFLDNTVPAIRNIQIVGKHSSKAHYIGPGVEDANRIAKRVLKKEDGLICNITIPGREKEVERLVAKKRAGADLFVTQIIMPHQRDLVAELVIAANRRFVEEKLTHAKWALSYTVITEERHVRFLRNGLRIDVPVEMERRMLEKDSRTPEERSIVDALETHAYIKGKVEKVNPSASLGIHIEPIFKHHLEPSVNLANAFVED